MIRTRIAPSPTGSFHIGTARVSLYNRLFARKNWGKFILRMEDTDNTRSTKFFEQDIKDWLSWLWLNPDEGPDEGWDYWPYSQMQRIDIYQKYINKLLEKWKAYYARETSEELDNMRKESEEKKQAFVYKKIEYTNEEIEKFKEQWRKPVIRFQVDDKIVKFQDKVKWELEFDMSGVGDFVIMKSDWIPTFFFVNVIDDYFMKISTVIRWEDHVSNTPKQILLYESLDWDAPDFAHLPMLLNPNKSKISKRDTDNEIVTISKFKEAGFLKEALINFIALLWWHPSDDREFFDFDWLIENFSLERVAKSNAIYDYTRALRMNWEYIRNLSDKKFVDNLIEYLKEFWDQEWKEILEYTDLKYFKKISPYIKVRIQTLAQFKDYAKYFFKQQFPSDEILLNKKMKVDKGIVDKIVPEITFLLSAINHENRKIDNIKNLILAYIQEKWYKNWQVLWSIRAILTWVSASPWAFEMIYVLGKEETIKRLKDYEQYYISK